MNMDQSIVSTTNDSFAIKIIQFLKSIQDNNNIVNQEDVKMFEFLLTCLTANSVSSIEKEMIMDIAISIGNHAIVESLSKYDFVVSYQNLKSVVFKLDFLSFLLTKRHIINKLDSNNQPVYEGSPLHQAMREVELESAKVLKQHGAFIDIDKALENAVESNHEKALQFLILEFHEEVGQKLKSPKLLCDAVKNSSLEIIPVLLDHGADINAKDETCVIIEALDVHVLELLLSLGADPNFKIGEFYYTYPLHMFLAGGFENRKMDMWRSLPDPAMSKMCLNKDIKEFAECLLRHGAQVDLVDGFGNTALHVATQFGRSVDILEWLIDSGLDVNTKNGGDETPLWGAVFKQDIEAVKFLIDAGADINLVCKFSGQSYIFKATNETILKIMLDNGANMKVIDNDGNSTLHCLLMKAHIGVKNVKRLIDAGCDVNHKNNHGYTSLMYAVRYVDIKLLELLVEEGADVNASGKSFPYRTAVTEMFIKLWNHPELATSCINYLIDHNANIDNMNSSVIHVFITSGCFSLIPRFISRGLAPAYLLMEKRPDTGDAFKIGISPLHMALLLNQSDLAQYFISIRYLLRSDIAYLNRYKDAQIILEEVTAMKSLSLLEILGQQPFSLETLCFVVISDTLGPTQDRRSKVHKLGLPQILQDSLLFQNITVNDIKDDARGCLVLFKKSLEQLNLYQMDLEDENGDSSDLFSNDDFD